MGLSIAFFWGGLLPYLVHQGIPITTNAGKQRLIRTIHDGSLSVLAILSQQNQCKWLKRIHTSGDHIPCGSQKRKRVQGRPAPKHEVTVSSMFAEQTRTFSPSLTGLRLVRTWNDQRRPDPTMTFETTQRCDVGYKWMTCPSHPQWTISIHINPYQMIKHGNYAVNQRTSRASTSVRVWTKGLTSQGVNDHALIKLNIFFLTEHMIEP